LGRNCHRSLSGLIPVRACACLFPTLALRCERQESLAQERKWSGEILALTQWTPSIGLTPDVLNFRRDPFAVLISEVSGRDAESISLDSQAEEKMWAAAGVWLARLHSLKNEWLGNAHIDGSPDGSPSKDPVAFVRATFDRRLAEAIPLNLFDANERDFIVHAADDLLPSLKGETAVAIHRDFTPRNWLVDGAGNLSGIIDFEHSRWDVRAADLNRPPDKEFLRNPRLRDAFFSSYGQPSEVLKVQIQALRLMQAVAAIVWGVQVGELDYSSQNREALHRMIAEGNCQ